MKVCFIPSIMIVCMCFNDGRPSSNCSHIFPVSETILIPVFTFEVAGLKEAFSHWWLFTCCLKMESLTLLDVDNELVFTHTHK